LLCAFVGITEATHGMNKINFRTVLQFQKDVYDETSGCKESGLFTTRM
jgi:hypothetical protein